MKILKGNATDKQKAYMDKLGIKYAPSISRAKAHELISRRVDENNYLDTAYRHFNPNYKSGGQGDLDGDEEWYWYHGY